MENLANHGTQKILGFPVHIYKIFKVPADKNGFVHLRVPDDILCCTGNLLVEIGMTKAEYTWPPKSEISVKSIEENTH